MDFHGLTITIGCPGSGKSTWADDNLPSDTLRLERDRFRECLFGSRRAYHDSAIPHNQRSYLITQSMGAAMVAWPIASWAVTDTGLAYPAVEPFVNYALVNGQDVRLMIFERDPDYLRLCNRIRAEEHRVPDDLLENCIEQFEASAAWWRNADFEKHYAPRINPLKVA